MPTTAHALTWLILMTVMVTVPSAAVGLFSPRRVWNVHRPSSLLSSRPSLFLLSSPADVRADANLAALLLTPSVFCVRASDEVTMEEVGQAAQLRAGELIIIVVVLIMWAGNVPPSATHRPHTHCRSYRILLCLGVNRHPG